MKKTYFSPEMETVELKFSQVILTGSIGAEGGNSDGGVTPGTGDPSNPGWGSDY